MKKTIPLGKYLGGVLMQMAMVEAGTLAMVQDVRYIDLSHRDMW